jgi:WD40 repeat protein
VTATVAGYVEGDVRDGIGYITDRQVTNLIDPTTGEAKPGTVSGELVAVGRNGRIVTANREDSVTVWAAGKDTNARKSPLVATPAGAIPLALAPDGTTALALTPDSSVQAFDARSGKPLGAPYRLDATTEPLTVRYSPDGRFVAFGASDFALVDLKDARKVASGTCFSGSFAFADNGTAFVVLKDATTVQIRRLDKADDVRTFTLTNPLPTTSRGSFDSALRRMIYSTANGGAVTVAEFTDGVAKERSVVLSGTLAGSAAFDGKGTRLALPYASGKSAFVHVLELRRDRTTTFEFAQNATPQDICVAFDRDGERLVASSPSVERSGRTTCWDARSGAMLWSTPVGGTRIQYNTSETRLAVGGVVLDARTGFPFPVRSSVARTTNASDAPTVALLSDESYVALTDGGVVTVSVSTSKWTPTDVVERTAAVTGIQPTGSSSEPVRLDPQALAELRRRLRTER